MVLREYMAGMDGQDPEIALELVETAYGFVVEKGVTAGAFLFAVQVSPAGLMARYQSFFTTDFDLVDRR